jgi:hypothetical protein
MRFWFPPATALFVVAVAISSATASTVYPVPAKAEIDLKYGDNKIKVGDMVLNIVKSFVGTLTASGFDTYTTFVLPDKSSERWMMVTTPADKAIGYNFRDAETGDANVRATSFYKNGNHLFVVAAERDSLATPVSRAKKGAVVFRIYKFNGDWDVPQFDPDGMIRAKQSYQDAAEALNKEFYKR